MTDPAILGALGFVLMLIVLVLLCAGLVASLRERAYQRAREAEYAEQWQAIHRKHQHDDRHTHHDERRPE